MGEQTVVRSSAAAALLLGLFAAVYAGLVLTVPGQRWDAVSLGVGGAYAGRALGSLASLWRALLVVVLFGYGLALLVLSLRRSRRRRCLVGIALVVITLGIGEAIKDLLPRPYLGPFGYPANSLPSVHAVASTTLLLGLLLVLPERARRGPTVLLVWLLAVPLAYASVLTQAHLTSDVLCGVLLAGAAAAVAGPVVGRPVVPPGGRRLWPLVPVGLVLGLLVGRAESLALVGLGELLVVASTTALVLSVLAGLSSRPAPTPT